MLEFIVRGGAKLVLENVIGNAVDRITRHGLSETKLSFYPWNKFRYFDVAAYVGLENGIGLSRAYEAFDAVVGVGSANDLLSPLHLFGADARPGLCPEFVHWQPLWSI